MQAKLEAKRLNTLQSPSNERRSVMLWVADNSYFRGTCEERFPIGRGVHYAQVFDSGCEKAALLEP